ncbi:MAG: PaaI family thioesterase [Pseudorhodoplanes sp.]
MQEPLMGKAELEAFLANEFPQVFHPGSGLSIEAVRFGEGRVRQAFQDRFVRPGGTISGPTMMALADFAFYVAVLSAIGPVGLAVTTNLNINFLQKPAQRDLVAHARMLKLGKRLAVMDCTLFSEGVEGPVAHVTATYSIPPRG